MAINEAYCKTNRECANSFEDGVQQRTNLNEIAANQNNSARKDVENTQNSTQTQSSNEE